MAAGGNPHSSTGRLIGSPLSKLLTRAAPPKAEHTCQKRLRQPAHTTNNIDKTATAALKESGA